MRPRQQFTIGTAAGALLWWVAEQFVGDYVASGIRSLLPDAEAAAVVEFLVLYVTLPAICALIVVGAYLAGRREKEAKAPRPRLRKFGLRESKNKREKLPGFSAHLILRITNVTALNRNYVFDFKDDSGATVSFYNSSSDRFALVVGDTKQESYSLDIPLGREGIPIGEAIYLNLGVGVSSNSTKLIAEVNGKEVANRVLDFPLDLGRREWKFGTIGSNVANKQHGGFSLGQFIVYPFTLNDEDTEHFIRDSVERHNIARKE